MNILKLIDKYIKTSIETERLDKEIKKSLNPNEDLQKMLNQLSETRDNMYEQINTIIDNASAMDKLMVVDVLKTKVEELYQNSDNVDLAGANKMVAYYLSFIAQINEKANQKTM